MSTLKDMVSNTKVTFSTPRFGIDPGQNDWPHIVWDIDVCVGKRLVYSGPYRSGLGCIDKICALLKKHNVTVSADQARVVAARGRNIMWPVHPELQRACVELAIMSERKGPAVDGRSTTDARPTTKDVIASLFLDGAAFFDGQLFEDWAADMGLSSDSIKAKAAYDKCISTGMKLAAVIAPEDLQAIREEISEL